MVHEQVLQLVLHAVFVALVQDFVHIDGVQGYGRVFLTGALTNQVLELLASVEMLLQVHLDLLVLDPQRSSLVRSSQPPPEEGLLNTIIEFEEMHDAFDEIAA